ncbi:hypothetical protein [Sinorhizobium americanum]|uniref:Uncharacterized protein n=1 Tax=Sinorhizobium americanum TaxID=194963 RepID=A0A1L3LMJ7_9HYPH|nr:hypothetical protein [Sinorhizobium americanum]APG84602.1 hypothetical protein SAMCCGM7_Ch1856 [Sinorhizobium americanum CCGM7]APG91256.1 hypothetical protein SAMCFNEI73_Ch1969 [Sinorhizobium americanum]TCN30448.1 hypothetical protein EV184_108328 [Sinorhizobium americanum]
MGLALFSMAMFFAMILATINALRSEARDRVTVLSAATDGLRRK